MLSLNLHRRHLSQSQLAFVALEIEKVEATLAKQRLATSTGRSDPQPAERIPQADAGKARDKAASAVGVNPRYVSDAAKGRLPGREGATLQCCRKLISNAGRRKRVNAFACSRASSLGSVAQARSWYDVFVVQIVSKSSVCQSTGFGLKRGD